MDWRTEPRACHSRASDLPGRLASVLQARRHAWHFAQVDQWLHRRVRMLMLKQWKRGRTMYHELQRRGVEGAALGIAARFGRSWWHMAAHKALQIALPGTYLDSLGVPRLAQR